MNISTLTVSVTVVANDATVPLWRLRAMVRIARWLRVPLAASVSNVNHA
ncbi:MAG: hypothetical protein JWM95_1695 [Gemmatimonadetes bacterium]|nr:hypothetical protein [Gemmatimonadota bacterium]